MIKIFMRLTDVDKLIEQERYYAKKYKGDFGEIVAVHMIEVLNSAPTIDAIPIAWIEERMEEYAEDRLYASSMILEMLITAWKRKRKEE